MLNNCKRKIKVIMLMAITLDGKIAKDSNHLTNWTGKKDKALFVKITKKAKVIIMGSKTFDTIKKPLSMRKNVVLTRNILRKSDNKDLIFTDLSPERILYKLEKEGYTEAVLVGGSITNTLFAKKNLIDEIIITISPQTFGTGISLFSDKIELNLDLIKCENTGENLICLHYKVLPV